MIATMSWPAVQEHHWRKSRCGPSSDAIPQPDIVDDNLVGAVTQARSLGGVSRLPVEARRQQEQQHCHERFHRG